MPTISNTPRPGYVYDSTDAVWYPIGTGTHSHNEIASTIVDAKGDIIAATAADAVSRLAVGANGTVLTAASGQATGLEWATPSAAGMTLLSTTTLSGASTTISITPTGYNSLYIFVTGVGCSTNTDFFAQINSVTATTYVNSSLGTIDATTGSVNGLKNGCYFNFAGANGYGTSTDNALVLQIPDPNGTKRKSMIFNAAYQLSGAAAVQFGMANANTAAAISTIKFELSGGATFSGGGTVTVYGVK